MAKGSDEDTHRLFIGLLMKEYGLPKEHRQRVLEEVIDIYDMMSFAHSHIMQSLMGHRPSARTHALEAFLEAHKTKEPKHRMDARKRLERQEREHSFREPRYS